MEINKRNFMLGSLLCIIAHLFAQGPNDSGTYYQSADGTKGSSLMTALFGVINKHTALDYSYIWTAVRKTDRRSDGKVWDMYSGITDYIFGTDQAGQYSKEGDKYNREHSFPKSWFKEASPMVTDLMHIVPTDGYVNGQRSNYPFGETDNPSYSSAGGFSKLGYSSLSGYSDIVFEPNDEYKGDFARIYFYMATCYQDRIANWKSDMLSGDSYRPYADWAMGMLMRWAAADPVSQKEIDRNNAVYEIQGNRNPFVDYPGLEQYVWGTMTSEAFSYDNYIEPEGGITPDPGPSPEGCEFIKVESADQLLPGYSYLIVYEVEGGGKSKAMAQQSQNIRTYADVTISADGRIFTRTGAEGLPYQLTLSGSTGAYTLYDAVGNVYLSYSGSKNYLLSTSEVAGDNEKWNIIITGGKAAITNVGHTERQIYYNTGSPRFACYKSEQAPVAMYRSKLSTSVEMPTADDGVRKVKVYSVTGVVVRDNVPRNQALTGLPKGIYIVDGHKYVVN